jgi:hypothetical protein
MHQQLWGYKVEWKSVSRGTGGKKVEYHWSKAKLKSDGDKAYPHARFEVTTEVKIHAYVFWALTLCSVVIGYQRFRGPCRLHLQGGMKMEEAWNCNTTR